MTKAKRGSTPRENPSPLPVPPELLAAHPGVSDALARWLESGHVPPVLLLTGPRGCGKRAIAYHVAQTLQCERAGFSKQDEPEGLFGGPSAPRAGTVPEPCGECATCARALSGQALDFKEIRLEADAQTFKIDQFRELKESLGFSGYAGASRIFLISEAERMTPQAANSLLKILEEPPEGWIFLLTVSDPSLLPSTVVSRCQMLRMRPLGEDVLCSLLNKEDIPSERITVLARIAEGSLSRARDLASDESWEARSILLQFLGQPSGAYHGLIDYASGDPARFRLLLDQFEHLLSDLIRRSRLPSEPYANSDASRALDEHAAKVSKRLGSAQAALLFWIDRSERLFRLRREMTAPLNQKILIQDFLSPWMDAV